MGGLEEGSFTQQEPSKDTERRGVGSRKVGSLPVRLRLQFLSEVFKDDIANESRDERDNVIGRGQDVIQGVSQGLAVTIGDGEFTHQKI